VYPHGTERREEALYTKTMLLNVLRLGSIALFLIGSSLAAPATDVDISNIGTIVNLRIEGLTTTIFEGPIFTRGHNVTTPSGGTHECNGLNSGANAKPGPTATSALADAARVAGFPFDGSFPFFGFDDFFITSIGPDANTDTMFWGILLGFQFTPVGGCQQKVQLGDDLLWAFDAFSADAFLKLSGPSVLKKGVDATFTVVDGQSGTLVEGAAVNGQNTGADGKVTLVFNSVGLHGFKATKESAIRSNRLEVLVV